MRKFFKKIRKSAHNALISTRCALESHKGEGYVDTGIKALIAVVLGALILSSLYVLINDDIDGSVYARIIGILTYRG